MKTLKIFAAISMMAAINLQALAQEPVIIVQSRSDITAPQIIVRSMYDFEQKISLKLKTDPRLLPSDVLINTISKIGMIDARGVHITSGFDIDPDHNIVVGFSGGTSEIVKIGQSFYGPTITASFRDSNGTFVSPPKDSLAIYNIDGEKLCFDYQDVTKTGEAMYFSLLLDRSWSMQKHIDDVKTTAKQFLNLLPAPAMCGVANFGHDWTYSHAEFKHCGVTDFGIDVMNEIDLDFGHDDGMEL